MRPISEAFRRAVVRSHRRAARITALDADLNPLSYLTGEQGVALSGDVTIDRTRAVRRTLNLSIANPDGALTPEDVDSFLYLGRALRVERGIFIAPGNVEYVDLGVFLIDKPIVDVGSSAATITVQGSDRLRIASRAKFTAPLTYPAGTRISTIVQGLAQDAGMGTTLYSLDDAGKTLAAARTWDAQVEVLTSLVDLARDYGLRLYVDAKGYLRLEPVVDPLTSPSAWTFERGADAIMLGVTKDWSDDRFYNEVVVSGEGLDIDPPIRSVAQDLNPASPGYVFGPMGRRTYFYSSAMIRTQAQADSVAAALLYDLALIEEGIRIPFVALPALEADDVVTVIEPASKTDDRFLIDSITIPIAAGTMSLASKKIRRLAA